jgi:hypothetical protein
MAIFLCVTAAAILRTLKAYAWFLASPQQRAGVSGGRHQDAQFQIFYHRNHHLATATGR